MYMKRYILSAIILLLSAVCLNAQVQFETDTTAVAADTSSIQCANVLQSGRWRPVAKQITLYDCVIVNRWGKRIAHLTDPSQYWDGTADGRRVPRGVYFYVITARGKDDREYHLSGDINVLR